MTGVRFSAVTLVGFHSLNLSAFDLAREYRSRDMAAYAELQDSEFAHAGQFDYAAAWHQRFVGTGYFDAVAQVISGGETSTLALVGSTEDAQFFQRATRACT